MHLVAASSLRFAGFPSRAVKSKDPHGALVHFVSMNGVSPDHFPQANA
jgi:hypothetical protein